MNTFASWVRSLWPFGRHMIIPERRAGTRVLTLKNVVRTAIGLVVAFILLSFWSAWRPAHSGTSLFEPRAASSEPSAVPGESLPVVIEGPVHDYPDAQLIVHNAPPPAPPVARETREPAKSPLGTGQKIVITGGSEGVHLYVAPPPQRARNRNRVPRIAQ
ncbi:MAG TPA: hypothetical protein VEO74_13425 [Thermoanaerobaculia bacterium]|nr:hypothetical protein [Thermoanaerobaculia bacterium]